MSSQNFKGKVYDDEATVSGVKVINRTQNILTYTDDNGNFKIEATVNDTIVLSSLFHLKASIVLTRANFEDITVFELKKAVNDLDEVLIKKEEDFKPFDAVESNNTLKNQILEDIKRNPHLYGKSPSGNMDFIAIAKLIGKLFKGKKPKEDLKTFANYNQLMLLFETNSYFNAAFLKQELKIEDEYKYLFFQFCEAHQLDSKLMLPDNRFELLDSLLTCSNEFLEFVNADKKD